MTRTGAGAGVLLLPLVIVAACGAESCSGCSCTGSHDPRGRESTRGEPGRSVREDPQRAPAAEPDPSALEQEPASAERPAEPAGFAAEPETTANDEEPIVTGTGDRPTAAQVGTVLRALRERVAGCSRGTRTSVVLDITLSGRSGRATSTRAIGPSAGSAEAACVEALVREARFPTFVRPEMTVSYAYRLPGDDPAGDASTAVGPVEADGSVEAGSDSDAGLEPPAP